MAAERGVTANTRERTAASPITGPSCSIEPGQPRAWRRLTGAPRSAIRLASEASSGRQGGVIAGGAGAVLSSNMATQLQDTFPADPCTPAEAGGTLILALPKGRILAELAPVLSRAGITPAADFADEDSRRLRFETNHPGLDVVRVRPFDVATFVAHGAAQIGVCGADVLMEFDYPEIYAPLDLGIGRCRVSVAEPAAGAGQEATASRITVASKYPAIAHRHFAQKGVQAEVVHLNGAMELAPSLGLSRVIVDLVQTGSTLKANGLVETEVIAHVTSRLIVNRTALKTRPEAIAGWIARFRAALAERDAR
jgi:ATP phosphoribosyltransferase